MATHTVAMGLLNPRGASRVDLTAMRFQATPMERVMRALWSFVGLLALGYASNVLAISQVSVLTSASATGSQIVNPVSDLDGGQNSASSSASNAGAGGTGDAFADLGVIKVFASMFSFAGNKIGSGSAKGSYSEDITISSAGLNGTKGRITVGVTLQGFIDPQGSGGGQVSFSFAVGNAKDSFIGSWNSNSNPSFPGGFPFASVSATQGGPLYYSAIHDLTADFTVGTAFSVSESLTASTFKIDCQGGSTALCDASSAGSVDIDFGHSSYWNGISAISLKDPVTGQFVPADKSLFGVSSASNANWFQSFVPAPVPEPETYALMLGGLALLGVVARRRQVLAS